MKKFFILTMLLMTVMNVTADDKQKLDAAKISEITFDGDDVTIVYTDGTTKTAMMNEMEAVTIDFSNVTGMDERLQITRQLGLEGKQVYDLQGRKAGKSAAGLQKGIYVIDGKKVMVK
ncbi:MAG: hypothetical protein K5764_03740 [Prevotella sp.]|nr:hypothetical protein [Prevotella sp.]